ncbi:MAG: hypothetical protein J5802_00165 [Butyrivibrio sp.]|nr:hypothetical protein [Butyrivibrio sp.]
MKKKVFALAALAFLLAGCAKSSNGDVQSAAEVRSGSEAQSEVSENALTEEELSEFTELFNTAKYNGFLDSGFNSPKDIEWDDVFQYGAGINTKNISDEEEKAYLDEIHHDQLYETLIAIKKTDMMGFIEKHAGYEYAPDKDDLDTWEPAEYNEWVYLEKYDSYYFENYYYNSYWNCRCIYGEKEGNVYTLKVRMDTDPEHRRSNNTGKNYGRYADRVLKVTKENDELVMMSNEIQWDDLCVKEKTFDVDMPQFDSTLRFYTYNVDPDEAEIEIVKDGKHFDMLVNSVSSSMGLKYLTSIDDIGFFDFNADGFQDIAVLGNSFIGEKVILHEYDDTANGFNENAELDEENTPELKGNLTIAGVKKYLLGDNENAVYSNYKEVYAQMAKVYHIADDSYKFDLVYIDDDDIPELVVDCGGCLSLFAYEDGYIHRLMDGWGYGAFGNYGYSYAERKGIFFNENSDYAGAIHYTTVMSKRDKGEIATDYYVKFINFNDLDGNGEPSEEELEAEGGGTVEYYNGAGEQISEKEYEKLASKDGSICDSKDLGAHMDYDTLLTELEKLK